MRFIIVCVAIFCLPNRCILLMLRITPLLKKEKQWIIVGLISHQSDSVIALYYVENRLFQVEIGAL